MKPKKMNVYLFTDGHFSAADNTVVSAGDKAAIEASLGGDRLGTLFSGSVVYSNRANGQTTSAFGATEMHLDFVAHHAPHRPRDPLPSDLHAFPTQEIA